MANRSSRTPAPADAMAALSELAEEFVARLKVVSDDELTALMGGEMADLNKYSAEDDTMVILMAGLQGVGKTTACVKPEEDRRDDGRQAGCLPSPPRGGVGRQGGARTATRSVTCWAGLVQRPERTSTARSGSRRSSRRSRSL